jgi:excisionase family DNA binding protein
MKRNPGQADTLPRYMTAGQVAAYIGSTEPTIRTWTSRRKIPAIRKGRFVRYDRDEIDRWMKKDAVGVLSVWEG